MPLRHSSVRRSLAAVSIRGRSTWARKPRLGRRKERGASPPDPPDALSQHAKSPPGEKRRNAVRSPLNPPPRTSSCPSRHSGKRVQRPRQSVRWPARPGRMARFRRLKPGLRGGAFNRQARNLSVPNPRKPPCLQSPASGARLPCGLRNPLPTAHCTMSSLLSPPPGDGVAAWPHRKPLPLASPALRAVGQLRQWRLRPHLLQRRIRLRRSLHAGPAREPL